MQEISPAVHKKMRRLTHGAEKRRDKTKARSLVGKRASLTCCFLRLLELLLQAATAKYQTSRLFVQKRTRFVQGPAVLVASRKLVYQSVSGGRAKPAREKRTS
ncbi:hypothetical protein, partial [Eggerthella lenta]|uniref:hypothetical protein n=1 Tax=Eggerthella lenta TaxID=84112 RepID=UPI001C921E4E